MIDSTIYTYHLAEMLTDASIDRVMAIDTQWKIIAWNRTGELISGITKQQVLGKSLLEVFPEFRHDEEMMKAFEFALQGKKSFLESRSDFFNRVHYENHFIPLTEENGIVMGVMNIMHDVAHRVKSEQELQKLNAALKEKYIQLEKATAELATFTAITGTELKEPIRNVYTALEYLVTREGKNFSNNGRASLRRIQASLNRMNLLLDDILAFSTANSFSQQFTRIHLEDIIQEVLTSLHSKIREKQAIIKTAPLPELRGSRQMLYYLFYNIIDNALKFHEAAITPQINITCKTVTKKDRLNTEGSEKEYCCISFIDNGIGFDAADKEKLFSLTDRFKTHGKNTGTGMALAICRKIAEAHGGYIEAEGIPGKGASFFCYFDTCL